MSPRPPSRPRPGPPSSRTAAPDCSRPAPALTRSAAGPPPQSSPAARPLRDFTRGHSPFPNPVSGPGPCAWTVPSARPRPRTPARPRCARGGGSREQLRTPGPRDWGGGYGRPRERGARGGAAGRVALSESSLFLPAPALSRGTALGGRACQLAGTGCRAGGERAGSLARGRLREPPRRSPSSNCQTRNASPGVHLGWRRARRCACGSPDAVADSVRLCA